MFRVFARPRDNAAHTAAWNGPSWPFRCKVTLAKWSHGLGVSEAHGDVAASSKIPTRPRARRARAAMALAAARTRATKCSTDGHLPAARKLRNLNIACVFLIVGIWIEKGMGLIVPAFIPSPLGEVVEYAPTINEILDAG